MTKFSASSLCVAAAIVLNSLAAGSASAQIRIGQTTGLTGQAASAVADINIGAKLYLDSVNAEGGIGGQQIELVSLDDQNQVKLAAENGKKLIADPRIVALFLTRGTPHAQALLPILAEGRIVLLAPSTGAMALHDPVNPWVFNVRATYQKEAERVTAHLGMGGLERVAVVYLNDAFGEDGAQGAMKVFKEAKKEPALFQAIDKSKPDFGPVVAKIVETKPLGVLMIGTSVMVASGVKALREAGSMTTVATLSNNAAVGFVKELGPYASGVIVSQVFPSERRLAIPMIADAARLAAAKKIAVITPAMMEGFAAAKVLVIALKRAAKDSKDVTRASVKRALESFSHVDIGGQELSYSPTDHTGLDFVDLSIINEGGSFKR
jgi:ABC-type branched-subunit amino acid transport system substrate-binding protein